MSRRSPARLLPAVRAPSCVACGGPVVAVASTQLALFLHAGYGAAERSRFEHCVVGGCGSVRRVGVDSVNPRAAVAG